jgi:hypothetical protein
MIQDMETLVDYVDGTSAKGEWATLRADGVDAVTIAGIRIAGHSLYWLTRVTDGWIAGAASFYPQAPFEVFISDDGNQTELDVKPDAIRDLAHRDVKLGWWWRG